MRLHPESLHRWKGAAQVPRVGSAPKPVDRLPVQTARGMPGSPACRGVLPGVQEEPLEGNTAREEETKKGPKAPGGTLALRCKNIQGLAALLEESSWCPLRSFKTVGLITVAALSGRRKRPSIFICLNFFQKKHALPWQGRAGQATRDSKGECRVTVGCSLPLPIPVLALDTMNHAAACIFYDHHHQCKSTAP